MPHQSAVPAGGEWTLPVGGWVFLHSISGSGYWRQQPRLAEFNPGDTLAVHLDGTGTLLASRLGALQFHWFSVCPEFLSNILGLEEQAALEAAARRDAVRRFPAGHSVAGLHARLIEAAGLKGFAIGGARISPVHANFIEAGEGCRAADVIALMDEARRRVRDAGGPVLHAEVRYLHPEWGIGAPPLAEIA